MEESTFDLAALFSISREAVIGVRKGLIAFMNPAAVEKTGKDSTGKPALAILPEDILNNTSGIFVSSAVVSGRRAAVSASMLNDMRVYMLCFEPETPQNCLDASITVPARTLLSNIKLATERLAAFTEDYGDDKLSQCTAVLQHSYHQLRRLMLNISTAGALSTGDVPFLPVATEIRELCAGITGAASYFAEKHGISINFECALETCDAVVDRELIEQMLLNLLSNSLLHTDPGGTVRVSLQKSGERLIISVDDNGSGIPPEILSTVFCRWKQSKSMVEAATGAGLGLGVARGIAERHGGALLIESKEGKGTSVRVMLPTNNEKSVIFRSSETAYSLDNMNPVLIQLSTWLPASEYGQMLND